MNDRDVDAISATADHVRKTLAGDGSGHDWWHIARVWRTARELAAVEGGDACIIELAALLHDIADWKFHNGDLNAGPRAARGWLQGLAVPERVIEQVATIIAELSFKGAGVPTPMSSLEGAIVQDADRLDALGAIGIARTFAYGGHAGRLLYDPGVPPEPHATFAAYRRGGGPSVNHFYEKLLLLRDRMNTATARQLAEERHQFLLVFLERFLLEWHGSDGSPEAFRLP